MADRYPPLNITPHWATMNANLVEIVGLIPEDNFDWSPAPSEWSIRLILVHIIMARYFGPLSEGAPPDSAQRVVESGKSRKGLQRELEESWRQMEQFLSDEARLSANYDPLTCQPSIYQEPGVTDGHYIAYHRFAHDIHHRSTVLGHLRQIGVKIADHLIRPLD